MTNDEKSVEQRENAYQLIADTPSGHLALAAWGRIVRAIEREIEKERAR